MAYDTGYPYSRWEIPPELLRDTTQCAGVYGTICRDIPVMIQGDTRSVAGRYYTIRRDIPLYMQGDTLPVGKV
jgi:hypothetical protein